MKEKNNSIRSNFVFGPKSSAQSTAHGPSTCDQRPLCFRRKRCGESWRQTQVGRRALFLALSAPAHIQSALSILPRRWTLIGYEPKLNHSGLFVYLSCERHECPELNAISTGTVYLSCVRYINYLYVTAMFSDDTILLWLFSSRQRISNRFPISIDMFSGWVLCLYQRCHNIRISQFKQFWWMLWSGDFPFNFKCPKCIIWHDMTASTIQRWDSSTRPLCPLALP